MDNKETIIETLNIFIVYPPLTSRLICQLEFLKLCLNNSSVKHYLDNRNLKYSNQLNIVKQSYNNFTTPEYFPRWLSGFIEAKGCFSIGVNKNHSFLIVQNKDCYLIEAIIKSFNLNIKVRTKKKNSFALETHNNYNLNLIIIHCRNYPLLGEKSKALNMFIKARAVCFTKHKK